MSEEINFDEIKGWDIVELLRTYPQFADKCDLDRLWGSAWARLLEKQSCLIKYCDLSQLNLSSSPQVHFLAGHHDQFRKRGCSLDIEGTTTFWAMKFVCCNS